MQLSLVCHTFQLTDSAFPAWSCTLAPLSRVYLCLASRSPGAEWAVSLRTDVYVAVHGLCMPKAPSMPRERPRGDGRFSQLCHTSQLLAGLSPQALGPEHSCRSPGPTLHPCPCAPRSPAKEQDLQPAGQVLVGRRCWPGETWPWAPQTRHRHPLPRACPSHLPFLSAARDTGRESGVTMEEKATGRCGALRGAPALPGLRARAEGSAGTHNG